jgi:hypothetical protein
MFDNEIINEMIQAAEKQRKAAVQAWEQYVDHCEEAYAKFGKIFDLTPKKK